MDKKPIGVFDSGAGGLTVLKRLIELLPNEDFIYLGDTEKVPYGPRPKKEIIKYSLDCGNFLLSKDIKMLVVACNTASTIAHNHLEKICENIEIVELIRPASIEAVKHSKNGKIGIIATEATIKNNAYIKGIKLLEQSEYVKIYREACPLFVEIVENNEMKTRKADEAAKEYIEPLVRNRIDTLVLGCTHFPYLTDVIKKYAPGVNLVDPGKAAAMTAYQKLIDNDLLNERETEGKLEFYITKESENFKNNAEKILGKKIDIEEVIEIH